MMTLCEFTTGVKRRKNWGKYAAGLSGRAAARVKNVEHIFRRTLMRALPFATTIGRSMSFRFVNHRLHELSFSERVSSG